MKKRKTIGYISLAFLVITLAGCGYTKEEKADMKRYEAQGRENAKDYIKEKYGVDVKIREVTCEKYNSGPVPDFSPWKCVCEDERSGRRLHCFHFRRKQECRRNRQLSIPGDCGDIYTGTGENYRTFGKKCIYLLWRVSNGKR